MKVFTLKGKPKGITMTVKLRVDDENAYLLRSYAWQLGLGGANGNSYTIRRSALGEWLYLSHEIANISSDYSVRHKNSDTLDFTRANLVVGPARRKSTKTHCANGHELTEENTYQYTYGFRCKICIENNKANFRQKRKLMHGKI